VNREKLKPWVFGLGLSIYPIHNATGLDIVFLPLLGFAILAAVSITCIDFKHLDLGPRWIYIPLLIICAASLIQAVVSGEYLSAVFLPSMFLIYLGARKLGKRIFDAVAVLVVIEAVSCVVMMFVYGQGRIGGIISPTNNYSIAAAVLVIGGILAAWNGRWWVIPIALCGLVATTSMEGIVGAIILGIVVLARRDFGWKLGYALIGVAVVVVIVAILPIELWRGALDSKLGELSGQASSLSIEQRLAQYQSALVNFSWLGHGYETVNFNYWTVHQVPLIILDQLGPFAMIAWCVVIVYSLKKFPSKYAVIALVAMGLFDHLTWTQLAPWFWVIIGVASKENQPDYIFKGATWIGEALKRRLKPSKPPYVQPAVIP